MPKSAQKSVLPQELFEFVPALYPHVLAILKRSDLTGPKFVALSYVKHFGKPYEDSVAVPLSELTSVLVQAGLYRDDKSAGGFVRTLEENEHFFVNARPTREQMKTLFPDAPGYAVLVVMTKAGALKLAEVNDQVQSLFTRMLEKSPIVKRAIAGIFRLFVPIAEQLIRRLRATATSHE